MVERKSIELSGWGRYPLRVATVIYPGRMSEAIRLATIHVHHTESLIYTVLFVIHGIVRYIYSPHRESVGGDPASQIFRDPHLLLAIVCCWRLLVG